MEAGHNGRLVRGHLNYLSPNQASAEAGVEGFVPMGEAKLRRVRTAAEARAGEAVLEVSAPPGAGVETQGIAAKYWGDGLPDAVYIASAYLRSAAGRATVAVAAHDPADGQRGTTMTLTLSPRWQRAHSLVRIVKDRDAADLRLRVVNTSARAIRFQADALKIEHSGRYNHYTTPSTWVPGSEQRWTEKLSYPVEDHFRAEAGTVAFWVQPSDERGNHTYFCVGSGWKRAFRVAAKGTRLEFVARGAVLRPRQEITLGQWHHLAMCWDGTGMRAYIDGRPAAKSAMKTNATVPLDGYSLMIGFDTGDVTGAGATLDELMVFDRALTEDEVLGLSAATRSRRPRWPVAVSKGFLRRGFSRSERQAALPMVVQNVSKRDLTRVSAEVAIDGHYRTTKQIPSLAPGQAATFTPAFDMGLLSVGPHEITVRVAVDGEDAGEARFPTIVGPHKPANRMPLVAWWSFNDLETARDFVEHGVTGSYSFSRRGLDICAQLGIDGGIRLHTTRYNRYGRPEEAVWFKGRDRGVWWQSPRYREHAVREGLRWARRWRQNPHFVHFNINTEVGSQINTSPQALALYRRALGFDMPEFCLHETIHPPQLSVNWPRRIERAYPDDGIIAPDNKWFRFFKWYWEHGSGINTLDDRIALEAGRGNPHLLTLKEPALRWRPVFTHRHMAALQEWVYVPDPKNMIPVLERLRTACRGRAIYSGMPQLLFKKGVAAPFASAVSPELYREALWICLSRPVQFITIWGWHLVISDKPHNNPETYGEIQRMSESVIKPYGPLLRKLKNRPRRVAYLWSLGPDLFRKERFYWGAGRTYQRLAGDGVLADVLYDDSIVEDNALSLYDALILSHAYALPRPVYDRIAEFGRRGGLILADEHLGCALPHAQRIDGMASEAVQEALAARGLVDAQCLTPDVVLNLRQCGPMNAVVLVNDKRTWGPLFGEFRKVREKGVAQRARLRFRASLGEHVYDLTASQRLPVRETGDAREAEVDLSPCAGRILGLYPAAMAGVEVSCAERTVARGQDARVEVHLFAAGRAPFEGAVPVHVAVRRADGAADDFPGEYAPTSGRLSLRVPVAFDAPRGEWSVTVRERASGRSAQTRFRVR